MTVKLVQFRFGLSQETGDSEMSFSEKFGDTSLLNHTNLPDSEVLSNQLMFIIEGILLGTVACFGIAGKTDI